MSERVASAKVESLAERYSNQGRWGANNPRGTLNHITPSRTLAACTLPRQGLVISCALPFDRRAPGLDPKLEPRHEQDPRPQYGEEPATPWAAEDGFGTQWNPQSSVFYDARPSLPRASGDTERRRSPSPWSDPTLEGVVGRGVLLDLPRFLRRPWLDNGTRILPRDLDGCAEALGVTVETGDVLLIRTGMLTRCFYEGSWEGYRGGPGPGLSLECARWIYEREIAAIATDTWSVEVIPSDIGEGEQPLYRIAQREMGLLFGESFHMDPLSEACAADGNYAFLFSAPLTPLLGMLGYPINPLAIK